MKVILLKDVARLGRRSEVKEVPAGHAINFLIPRKLAIIATEDSLKRHTEETKKQQEQKQHTQEVFTETLKRLSTETVPPLKIEANDKGHLFKGINVDDIARHLLASNIKIEKGSIKLAHPIKEIGIHKIPLKQGTHEGILTLEIVKK